MQGSRFAWAEIGKELGSSEEKGGPSTSSIPYDLGFLVKGLPGSVIWLQGIAQDSFGSESATALEVVHSNVEITGEYYRAPFTGLFCNCPDAEVANRFPKTVFNKVYFPDANGNLCLRA